MFCCWCSAAAGPAAASAERSCSFIIQQSKFILVIPAFCIKGTVSRVFTKYLKACVARLFLSLVLVFEFLVLRVGRVEIGQGL